MPRLFPSHWWWFGCKVQIEQDFSSFSPLLVLIWCQFSICEILKKIINKLTNFSAEMKKKKFCSTCLSKLIFWLLHPENWKSDFGYCPIIPSSLKFPNHLQKFNSLPSHCTPFWIIRIIFFVAHAIMIYKINILLLYIINPKCKQTDTTSYFPIIGIIYYEK